MQSQVVRRFGARIRERLKSAGVGNVQKLFKSAGYGGDIPSDMVHGRTADVGAMKLANAAILAGVNPADLFHDLADTLLNPPLLRADDAKALRLGGWPHAYPDQQRLSVVADTVLQAIEEQGARSIRPTNVRPDDAGELVAQLYMMFVETDPGISHLQLRRKTIAFMLEIDLPKPDQRRDRKASIRGASR